LIPDTYFERFDTKKYRSKNPVQRLLIKRFVDALHSLFIEANPVRTVLEVGVGEGFLSGYLSEKFPAIDFTGVDLLSEDLERLRQKFPRVKAHQGSIYDLGFLEARYDLVICAEVLEHLERPDDALGQIAGLRPSRTLLSVPHEPWFMLSNLAAGKNVTRLGNDVEHINHYTVGRFRRLLEPRFDVLRITTSYPWILALSTPR